MITFDNVFKSFNGRLVLRNLNLSICRNESVGLLGRSGSGKSTILNIIVGLTAPDSGTVEIGSHKIANIFQEPRLIPWRNALDNIGFVLMANGMCKNSAREAAFSYLHRMDLEGFEYHYPKQLSGGMQQRVAIARAFAAEPEILLMDEPFSALDPRLKDMMHTMTGKLLSEQPVTMVYVSHNPDEVARIADRICIIGSNGAVRDLTLKYDNIHGMSFQRPHELAAMY